MRFQNNLSNPCSSQQVAQLVHIGHLNEVHYASTIQKSLEQKADAEQSPLTNTTEIRFYLGKDIELDNQKKNEKIFRNTKRKTIQEQKARDKKDLTETKNICKKKTNV